MTKADLVSIIIPTYNRRNLVIDALDSTFEQTYRPLEVIVVDDGSTDNTVNIVRDWVKKHESSNFKVYLLTQENKGAPAARNYGLEKASAKWIKFLDSDDLLHTNCITNQVKASQTLDESQIIFGDLGKMKHDGTKKNPEFYRAPTEDSTFEYLLDNIVNTPTPLHRLKLLQSINGFGEDIKKGQEYDLHLRLAKNGVQFIYREGVVAYIRKSINRQGVTSNTNIQNDPDAHVFIQENRLKLAKEYYEDKIPQKIKKTLAQGFWMVGRQTTRAGHLDHARYCFEQSKKLSFDLTSHMMGPKPYKWLAVGIDPVKAEYMLSGIKKCLGR